MIISNDTTFYYAESVNGLTWTPPISLGSFADGVTTIAPYPTSVGLDGDPSILGKTCYTYFTFLHLESGGLPRRGDSLRRLTLMCP
jgi:hypothetical protein